MFHDILERKIAFLAYKKKEFKRTKNWDIFKAVSPWFGSKNSNIFHRFCFSKINQENVFDDILERKNPFLDLKKKELKNLKNWDFFIKKRKIYHLFLFSQIGQEIVFDDVLEKKPYLDYKKKSSKI